MTTWEQQDPFVAHDPPHWFVPALAWLMIGLFGSAVLAAIFVKVPETVQSPFVLTAREGAEPIQSPRAAVVEQILVRRGQTVRKGDLLFLLRTDQVREWRTESQSWEQSLRALRERAAKEEDTYAAAVRIKDLEMERAERDVSFRTTHLQIMQDLLARVEKLYAVGLISAIELSSHRLDVAQSEKDLDAAKKMLDQRRLERQQLESDRKQQRIQEQATAGDLAIRIAALRQPLAASANGLLEIRAPYDAVCTNVVQENPGRVVAPGDALCQLAPLAPRLQATLDLPQTAVSRIAPRQQVRLLFDAFPYQRFGVVTGQIDWVSPAAVAHRDGSGFIALASLDRSVIVAGAKQYALEAGMKGEARVTVGRRTLIEFALEPLHEIREDLRP